jgi:hypothetical protein
MLRMFKSNPPNNFFAPSWCFYFYEDTIPLELVDKLKNLVLQEEENIINKYPNIEHDGGTGLGNNSLTARFSETNLLTWNYNECKELFDIISKSYTNFLNEVKIDQPAYISAWANVVRQGQQIHPHWHSCFPDSYLGGHLVISAERTSTMYQNPYNPNEHWEFKNIPGNLTFFPNHLIHWTTVNQVPSPRITIAFDILTEEYIKTTEQDVSRYIPICL